MKKEDMYQTPQIAAILMEVEQCFATSDVTTSDESFTLVDFIEGGEL